MLTVTHTLTNGVQNFIFSVTDTEASLTEINEWGVEVEKEIMSVAALRQWWTAALKHGCKRGWTNPRREHPSAFESDDNRWEHELALHQS